MHTKNLPVAIISHCPLSRKLTFSKSTLYTRRCLEIIESARIVWGYYSDDYKSCCYEIVDGVEVPKKFPPYSMLKLISARSIQSWYTEHSDLFLASQKTSEAIKKAVSDARRYARLGIEKEITDKEILAVFAICEAYDAIYNIQCGKSEDAIKEKVLTASMFLKLAKAGIEPATQDVTKQNKFIPFPTPAGAKWNDLEMSFDEDNLDIVRVTVKNIKEVKNYAEMGFKNINTGLPNKLWKRLLEFKKGNIKYSGVERKKVESDISRLRKSLKKYFRIKDNPINLKHGYESAFKVNVMEKSNRSVYSFSNQDDYEEKEEND